MTSSSGRPRAKPRGGTKQFATRSTRQSPSQDSDSSPPAVEPVEDSPAMAPTTNNNNKHDSPLGGGCNFRQLMNPNTATPSPSNGTDYKLAVVELHKMSQQSIKMDDLKQKVRNRAKTVIYRRMKFLKQSHPAFETVKEYLRSELGLSPTELGHHWPAILSTAKDCLRQERGAAVQVMKKDFLGELLLLPLPDSLPIPSFAHPPVLIHQKQ